LQRRAEQLQQWERVIKKLMSRANKASDTNKTELHHHITKVLVTKARSKYKLWQLRNAGNEKWNEIKVGLEKNWVELRKAFLTASAKPNKEMSNSEK
jgi:hypothetical protein